jgi:TonB family protein
MRRFAFQSVTTSYSLSISLLLAFALLITPRANAQQPEINVLAARVAEEFPKEDESKKVIVFDFIGPDKTVTALGQKIADDFSEALSKTSSSLIIINRSLIIEAFDNYPVPYQILEKPELELWLTKKLGANFMVPGKLQKEGEDLTLSVNIYKADGTPVKGFNVKLPLTEQMKSLMTISAQIRSDEPTGNPPIDKERRSHPDCLYCPTARFSPDALSHHTQGTVILGVVIGIDGVAHDISVLKPLPNGLTENAIETVRSWKFRPAAGPDGIPTEQKTIIQVVFHLVN